jgi:hypothetical protein
MASAPEPQAEAAAESQPEAQTRPDWLPEKFWTPEGPNVENLAKSYGELDSMRGNMKAKVQEEWQNERLANRPEAADKYELPQSELLDSDALASSPLVQWWKTYAFESGLPNEEFQKGIVAYAESEAQRIQESHASEMAKLGENGKARAEAVGLWAKKQFQGEKFDALAKVCETAAGVEVIEQLMKGAGADPSAFEKTEAAGETEADIRKLMEEPTYWNASKRDPAVVKRVEDFFKKKYGGKK